ncbi:MAG: diguanylate cyclase [Marinobacter sp.]|nr:diguanylate cyclase [Marinobacter sp.]
MEQIGSRGLPLRRSAMIALTYIAIGTLWITFSDAAIERLIDDPALLSRAQTYKGWLFVVVTGSLLFMVLYRQLHRDRELLKLQDHQRAEILALSQFRESVIDNASIWINVLDPEGRVVLWNRAAEQISGYRFDQVRGSNRIWEWLYPDVEYRNQIWSVAAEILAAGREVDHFESEILTADGRTRVISWHSRRFYDSQGRVAGSVALGTDMTDIRQTEREFRHQSQQLANLMDNLPGMAFRCRYDAHWTMLFVSSGCEALCGYTSEQLVDNRDISWVSLEHPDDSETVLHEVDRAIAAAEPYELEYRIRHQDGRERWVWEKGRAVDEHGELILEGLILDITERKRLEAELNKLATHDPLTGLFNRRALEARLADEIDRANRYGRPLAVLWVDLDHFKRVNDHWGHGAGDDLLRQFSRLLEASVRKVDTVSRYGGEEFIILLPERDLDEAVETAERLRTLVAEHPFRVDGHHEDMTISLGVAIYPMHAHTASELCEVADKAMYQAKTAGRNRVAIAC